MIASRSNLKLRKDFEERICSYSPYEESDCPFEPCASLVASAGEKSSKVKAETKLTSFTNRLLKHITNTMLK